MTEMTLEEKRIAAKRKLAKQKLIANQQPQVNPDYSAAAGTIGSSIVTEPASGLVGLGTAAYQGVANLFRGEGEQVDPMQAGAQAVETFQGYANEVFGPNTEAHQAALQNIANAPVVKQIGEGMMAASKGAGEAVYGATGSPGLASFAEGAVMAAPEALGLRGASKLPKRVGGLVDDVLSPEQLKAQRIVESGKQFNIPVMTSDVMPPKTFIGKVRQRVSDDLGALGTGGKRAKQQSAREVAVQSLVDDLDIDLDTPFAEDVVKSLNATNKKIMDDAMQERIQVFDMLDDSGYVPTESIVSKIDDLIAKEKSLANPNEQAIKYAQQYKQGLIENPKTFRDIAKDRSQLINDRGEFSPMGGSQSSKMELFANEMKKALDEDMTGFAKKNNATAAEKWVSSNKKFANEFDQAKVSSVKRILEKGDATPEQIIPFIKSGKPSELQRLYGRLDDKGKASAQKLIIQQALKDAKYFEVDANPNPTLVANVLNRPANQQAMRVFFGKSDDKAGLNSLLRVLDNTREAQKADFAPKTGYTVGMTGAAGYGVGVGLDAGTLGAGALASAALKLYESPAFRNMLMKLSKVNKTEAAKLMAEMSGMITTAAMKAQKQEDASLSPYQIRALQARIAQGDTDAMRELDRYAAMEQQREQDIARQEATNFESAAINYGSGFLDQIGANTDMALETALDINSIASRPMPVAKQLITDLYEQSGVTKNIPIAHAFADLFADMGEQVLPIKNVLQNNGLLPPDDKSQLINKMIAMGTSPDNAVKTANKLAKLSKTQSKKVVEAIKTKIPEGQYKMFKPLINSIEGAV